MNTSAYPFIHKSIWRNTNGEFYFISFYFLPFVPGGDIGFLSGWTTLLQLTTFYLRHLLRELSWIQFHSSSFSNWKPRNWLVFVLVKLLLLTRPLKRRLCAPLNLLAPNTCPSKPLDCLFEGKNNISHLLRQGQAFTFNQTELILLLFITSSCSCGISIDAPIDWNFESPTQWRPTTSHDWLTQFR